MPLDMLATCAVATVMCSLPSAAASGNASDIRGRQRVSPARVSLTFNLDTRGKRVGPLLPNCTRARSGPGVASPSLTPEGR
jgi:hypothetical protein